MSKRPEGVKQNYALAIISEEHTQILRDRRNVIVTRRQVRAAKSRKRHKLIVNGNS